MFSFFGGTAFSTVATGGNLPRYATRLEQILVYET